jgi:hypothetical protein
MLQLSPNTSRAADAALRELIADLDAAADWLDECLYDDEARRRVTLDDIEAAIDAIGRAADILHDQWMK